MLKNSPFAELGVAEDILKSLQRMKFRTPTPVQQLTIEPFLANEDLLVKAPTGTGKTAAFGMPIIQRIDLNQRATQALILCPTRELALQITSVMRELSRSRSKIRIVAVYGGEKIGKQLLALNSPPHIIVATPGRLLDHMQRRTVRLSAIKTVVLDEADRMLDMGFKKDMENI
jgi:ATP-dependent RNA helicase DeaD